MSRYTDIYLSIMYSFNLIYSYFDAFVWKDEDIFFYAYLNWYGRSDHVAIYMQLSLCLRRSNVTIASLDLIPPKSHLLFPLKSDYMYAPNPLIEDFFVKSTFSI